MRYLSAGSMRFSKDSARCSDRDILPNSDGSHAVSICHRADDIHTCLRKTDSVWDVACPFDVANHNDVSVDEILRLWIRNGDIALTGEGNKWPILYCSMILISTLPL